MRLPAPNLDDRTFTEIVEEAKSLIPKYSSEWTDLNPSDPGITLLELMAWMTESILYRLNRVPEKNYIKFLDLIGKRLRTAQPARTWVVFDVEGDSGKQELPSLAQGTKLSTKETTGEPVEFETTDLLNLTSAKIIKICSMHGDEFADHTATLEGDDAIQVSLFEGVEKIEHILYLGADNLEYTGPGVRLQIHINVLEQTSLGLNVEWEYWDGQMWSVLIPASDGTLGFRRDGDIVFRPMPRIEKQAVHGITTHWVRARLLGVEGEILPRILSLRQYRVLEKQFGLPPDALYASSEKEPYLPLDSSRDFSPFTAEPAPNTSFNMSSKLLALEGAVTTLNYTLSRHYSQPPVNQLGDLKLHWEYFSQKGTWELLGITSPVGVIRSQYGFDDDTMAFTRSGNVRFRRPNDAAPQAIQGTENHWVRARIETGNYMVGEKSFPPLIRTLRFSFEEEPAVFQHAYSYNYFTFNELAPAFMAARPVVPFEILPDIDPTFYLALDRPLSNRLHRLFFRIAEAETFTTSRVRWEYMAEEGWERLKMVSDSSKGLTEVGAIEFMPPSGWTSGTLFDTSGYWMRGIRDGGSGQSIVLRGLHLNAVPAVNAITHRDAILGSSTAEPHQSFRFPESPILPDATIIVREIDNPTPEQVEQYAGLPASEMMVETDPPSGKASGLWVEWHEVEHLFQSSPEDRHYELDPYHAKVIFGDGSRGKIPPAGRDNVKCAAYKTGGGSRGNVGKNTISILGAAIPSISAVTNPESAEGGADAETIEEAKSSGPLMLKHRFRAVTIQDFEQLALEASGAVAKATCITETGEIRLIIVPKGDQEKLQPGSTLLKQVSKYLDDRRLVTTKIVVVGPGYDDVSVEAEIVLEPRVIELVPEMRAQIQQELLRFLHPLHGGPDDTGWQMGRAVHISELYYLGERIAGVDYVDKVVLNRDPWKTKVEIGSTSYPYLRDLNINFKGG